MKKICENCMFYCQTMCLNSRSPHDSEYLKSTDTCDYFEPEVNENIWFEGFMLVATVILIGITLYLVWTKG